MNILILLLTIFVKCLEKPCEDPEDVLFSRMDNLTYCYHSFPSGVYDKPDVLGMCSNWFPIATPITVHDNVELNFMKDNFLEDVGSDDGLWLGLMKNDYSIVCTPNIMFNMDGSDPSFWENYPNKNCAGGYEFCFRYDKSANSIRDFKCGGASRSFGVTCYFKIPICNGTNATLNSVCNGHGYCVEEETCVCDKDYFGEYCEETFRCGGVRQDESIVCNGHGNCTHSENCFCELGYFGDNCEDYTELYCVYPEVYWKGNCYRNFGSIGHDWNAAESYCSNNWMTEFGQITPHLLSIHQYFEHKSMTKYLIETERAWIGLRKNGISASCPPSGGYTWSDGSDDSYAVSRGVSVICDSEEEACFGFVKDDYFWYDALCNDTMSGYETLCGYVLPTCMGIEARLPEEVCSGRGSCIGFNNCTCYSGWYGSFCQIHDCFGVSKDEAREVCSGFGECIGPNVCSCDEGYEGLSCNITTCFGISSLDEETVCNGHGVCVAFNVCECTDWDYGGDECGLTYPCKNGSGAVMDLAGPRKLCYQHFDRLVDSEKAEESCHSHDFFSQGHLFSVSNDNERGILLNVFSGEANETSFHIGLVKNEYEFGTPGLNIIPPSGWFFTDGTATGYIQFGWPIEVQSNEVGKCYRVRWEDFIFDIQLNDNSCWNEFRVAYLCGYVMHECFGIGEYNVSVCNNNGFCMANDICTCKSSRGYVGDECETRTCYGIISSDVSEVCSGHGECLDDDKCICDDGFFGSFCNITSCGGIFTNDTEQLSSGYENMLCSGHGICLSPLEGCKCDEYYFGELCNVTYCNWILSSSSDVCSGKGRGKSCFPRDNCTCVDETYYGSWCEITTCGGVESTDPNVCNAGGECVGYDTCICDEDIYFGESCNVTVCNGIMSNISSKVCSGKGVCFPFEVCTCSSEDFFGDGDCDLTSCYGEVSDDSEHVCSGHGSCWPKDFCQCNGSYYGENCEVTTCESVYLSNETESVCNGHGICWPEEVCSCHPNRYHSGKYCGKDWDRAWIHVWTCENCAVDFPEKYTSHYMIQGRNVYCVAGDNGTSNFVIMYNSTHIDLRSYPYSTNCSGYFLETTLEFEKCYGYDGYDEYYDNIIESEELFADYYEEYTDTLITRVIYRPKVDTDPSTCTSDREPHIELIEPGKCVREGDNQYVRYLLEGDTCQIVVKNFTDVDCKTPSTGNEIYESGECYRHPFMVSKKNVFWRLGWIYEDNFCVKGIFPETELLNVSCDKCMDRCFGKYRFDASDPKHASTLCDGHGKCKDDDFCICDENYYGGSCNVTECSDGIYSNDTSLVCSNHGNCVSYMNCSCEENYFGFDCNYTYCNGIPSTETETVCTDRGECFFFDRCDCDDNYYGEDCNVTKCNDVYSNETSDVCNGDIYSFSCWPYEHCHCRQNYFGGNCDITKCNGAFSNQTDDEIVCSGTIASTLCWPYNKCHCRENYFGKDCEVTSCNGVYSNDSSCTDRGECWPYSHCDCEDNYFGESCNVTRCGLYYSNDTVNVCNGLQSFGDSCWPYNHCNCKEFYYGGSCDVTTCNGVYSNETERVCGGSLTSHSCWPYEKCYCKDNYYGDICNITTCYGVYSNHSDNNLCSQKGTCWPFDQCNCFMNSFGEFCNITSCFGIYSNMTRSVCSEGHGACIDHDKCICNPYYSGIYCNHTKCNGVWNNDSAVCDGHGTCDLRFRNCSCDDHYSSHNCQNYSCFNISHFNEQEVCSQHGDCLAHDFCACEGNYSYSSDCSVWSCYGKMNNDTDEVCSGHGECYDRDSCNCSAAYPGYKCHEWSCDGKGHNQKDACEGNGICLDWEVCACYPGYETPETYCVDYSCNYIPHESSSVCSRKGRCTSPDTCVCDGKFEGKDCETWSCGLDKDDPGTCSGHGKCIEPETCSCSGGFKGDLCDYNSRLAVGLGISLPLLGIGLAGLVVVGGMCLIFLFCVCLTLFILVFLSFIALFAWVLAEQKKRLKKFEKLKNFEMLLKEQMVEEGGEIAHIKINKSLFEIEFDNLEIVEVLGKGGSDSTVYKATWRNQEVAFKCFKTSELCQSQSNFEEFEREVSILSSVSHPNVIRFFGATLKPPRIGIVMEFCQFGDLRVFLFLTYPELHEGRGYPWEDKIRLCKEIVLAMEYLHSRSIIHRDLKLENVLVDEREICKIMDFGLSKVVDRLSQAKTQRIGTSIYISPEVILHSKYDEMCDVFSFAIMMFIIITGNLYPYGKQETCVELKVAQDPSYRPDIHELDKYMERNPETKWLKKIVQVCWNHDPKKRLSFKMIGQFLIKCETKEEPKEVGGELIMNDDTETASVDFSELESLTSSGTNSNGEYSMGGVVPTSNQKQVFQEVQELLVKNEGLEVKNNMLNIKVGVLEDKVLNLESRLQEQRERNKKLAETNDLIIQQLKMGSRFDRLRNKNVNSSFRQKPKRKAPPRPKPKKAPPKPPKKKMIISEEEETSEEEEEGEKKSLYKKMSRKPPPVPSKTARDKAGKGGRKGKKPPAIPSKKTYKN